MNYPFMKPYPLVEDLLRPVLRVTMPRQSRLDDLPLFVRNLQSRSSPGIFGPALGAGSTTGVLQHLICHGIEWRLIFGNETDRAAFMPRQPPSERRGFVPVPLQK